MNLLAHLLSGVSFGMLLFLVASGLTLSFGLMRVVNLAHGSFYLIGGYIGLEVLKRIDSYPLAVLAAVAATALLGLALERLIARLHGEELPQIVFTVGVAFIIGDLALITWGGVPQAPVYPPYLGGSLHLRGFVFPVYRLSLIVLGLTLAGGLAVLMERTRLGAMVRASVDDEAMARASGVPAPLLFALVFGGGAALAGFAGLWGGAFTGVYPGVDFSVVLLSLVVVVVGGLGSLRGAFLGCLVIGILNEFGQSYFATLSYFTLYLPVIIILLLRPRGLFGRE